ncbi:CpsD/CapB family tyrosine-protein kinase [Paenibacillus validus]|uniref:CpsD/CapB family tyrosine-protein kinase n=1 Tax=Paenibacillus validus TaxID=44253 RepID=UPI003D281167
MLRTNIQFAQIDKSIQRILITSTCPGEGKSTTISNLGIAFAQEGKNVVLVDADLRNPSLHKYFKKSNRDGITNVLTGQSELLQSLHETHVDNLTLLTAGPAPHNPAEMLSSNKMDHLIEELCASYDYVLFDSPPTLAVTDSQVLSAKCDGVVFVVSSGKVKNELVKKAIARLQHVQAKILGVVLNKKEYDGKNQFYYSYDGSNPE